MKMNDLLAWMVAKNRTHGDSNTEADTVAEAEQYLSLYPLDLHGFAVSVVIHVETKEAAFNMLASAGYLWTGEKGSRVCSRSDFHAKITSSRLYTAIFLNREQGLLAMATGPDGYLHPDDRPEV